MKGNYKVLSLLAVTIVAVGITSVYADEFIMPFGGEHLVDNWVDIVFNPTGDGGVDVRVIQTSLFHYNYLIEMPDQFSITKYEQDGGQETTTVVVKEIYKNLIAEAPEEPEEEIPFGQITPEMRERIEEKISETEKLFEEAIICRYGEGGTAVFQAKRDVIVLRQMEQFKQLPSDAQHTRLLLATEACNVFRESDYYRYPQYEDIAEAQSTDIQPFVLDETDSPLTDPVTQRDLDKAEQRAIDTPTVYKDPNVGCIPEFEGDPRCEARTGPAEPKECQVRPNIYGDDREIMCPLQAKTDLLEQAVSDQQNYDNILQIVCDTYLPQYMHIVDRILAEDPNAQLPGWLSHCELNN